MAPGSLCVLRVRAILLRSGEPPTVKHGRMNAVASPCDCNRGNPSMTDANGAELLLGAISAAYAEALGVMLRAEQLPWRALEVVADVASTADPAPPRLDTVVVHPTILGGDLGIHRRYRPAAQQARDRSLIGQAIRGNVAYYKLGEVMIVAPGGGRPPPQRAWMSSGQLGGPTCVTAS